MTSGLHRVVIVGGGAGGLGLATRLGKTLGKKGLAKPILLDRSPTHIWKPLLHEVATGRFNMGEDEVNYFTHSVRNCFEFQYGWMEGIDRDRKVVKIAELTSYSEGYKIAGPRELPYDTLVLAVGGTTETYGTPGVREHCICLDTPKEAERIRKRLLNNALSYILEPKTPSKLRIGIVGGGATGVELAAEIHYTLCQLQAFGSLVNEKDFKITILEGGPRILGGGIEAMSKYATQELKKRGIEILTNCSIQSVNEDGFVLKDGTLLKNDVRIWAAGVRGFDWFANLGLEVNRVNRVKVDRNLQSVDDANIFAIGDCACAPMNDKPNQFLPASAQVAHQQGKWLAKKLKLRLKDKPCDSFVFDPRGMLVSLGEGSAVGNVVALLGHREHYVSGRGAKALYESLYRMHQAELHGWTRVGFIWIADRLRMAAFPQLKLH